MKRLTIIGLNTLALLSALSFQVMAADQGFYAGASLGKSRSNLDSPKGDSAQFVKSENDSTSWKIFGGYQFSKNLAAEAFAVDLGKAERKFSHSGESASLELASKGLGMVGVVSWPASDQLSLYGKGGFLYWTSAVDVKSKDRDLGSLHWKDDDKRDFSPMLGLGTSFALNKQVSFRLEWERYLNVGKQGSYDGADIDLLTAGVVYAF